jgi:hypothetical protein
MEMIGARHSSRLREAIMGKNKSDVIDSEVRYKPSNGRYGGP